MAPFHSISTVTLRPGFQNASTTPYSHIIDTSPETQPHLNVEANDFDLPNWHWTNLREPKRIPHISTCWRTSKEYCAKRALAVPPPPPSFEAQWDICHLLSLPKELRLEIWRYVLTDPSVDVAVQIVRGPTSPHCKSNRKSNPLIKTYLDPKRTSKINLGLLRVDRFIYDEALPVLYNSVRFNPLDLEGIFPLFLASLPSYGPSLIRHVQMRIPAEVSDIQLFGGPSTILFHWAITCAQVAKLEALRDVEIVEFSPDFSTERVRWGIMKPLRKIKAKKIFTGENEEGAQQMFADEEQRLKAQAGVREGRTKAEAEERAKRDGQLRQQKKRREEERKHVYPLLTLPTLPTTNESIVERAIGQMPGIRQFEKELKEHAGTAPDPETTPEDEIETEIGDWDLVSLRSAAPTPKAGSPNPVPEHNGEAWPDTASTIVDREESKKEQDDDTSSEQWEDVNEYPLR